MSDTKNTPEAGRLVVDGHGFIQSAAPNGRAIPFRRGEWRGPAWRVAYGGETHVETDGAFPEADGAWLLPFWQVMLRKRAYVEGGTLVMRLEAENAGSQPFCPDSLGITLGVDTYMDRWPDWDDKLFPTLLRCEKTHFYGYFASPGGRVLAVCSPQPVCAWQLHYNGGFADSLHRVEGVTLLLMSAGPLPERHPVIDRLEPGEKRVWEIRFHDAETVDQALAWAAEETGAAVFTGERLIFEPEETARLTFRAPGGVEVSYRGLRLPVTRGADGSYTASLSGLTAGGTYPLTVRRGDRVSEVLVYCRRAWSWYLRRAADEAVRCEQKATSHIESWYGYFSGLLAMRYAPDAARDRAILRNMEENIPLVYDMATGRPTVIPHRIQNTAGVVSFSVDAWEATRDGKWLALAEKAADFLVDECQDAQGAFRSGATHYTCVLYIAKAIQELWLAERAIPGHEARAEKYFASVRRAVDDLVTHCDNIGTEGEHTFEDGMISCSMTQIGFFALYLPPEERAPYIRAAETMLKKHRCLERMGSPDCRSRNTTIRYWESQYDVLVLKNMITSPHGWSAWKAYGVWYLYLLTGRVEYLTDAMELLGCCAQLIGPDGRMNWAFVVDPIVRANVMAPDEKGRARPVPSVFGECYLPMISGWYKTPRGRAAFGYLGTYPGFDTDEGGCCDNDVHEWVKAMGEIALTSAYAAETDGGLKTWNMTASPEDPWDFTPRDGTVTAVHMNLGAAREVTVRFARGPVRAAIQTGWLRDDGRVTQEPPM